MNLRKITLKSQKRTLMKKNLLRCKKLMNSRMLQRIKNGNQRKENMDMENGVRVGEKAAG